MKADLHIHTTASDGAMTPTQIVEWAKSKGIDAMSITDHDRVSGLDEGREAAKKAGIKFVHGIEISTYAICEIHILGYNFDYKNPDFVQSLTEIQQLRVQRNLRIAQKLSALNINLQFDFSADGVGRMNIARAMVEQGFCKDINEVFDKYLGVHGKAYSESKRITPMDAVKLIKKFGGVASIAHPKKYFLDGRLDLLVDGLKKFGLDAIEVYYPSHTAQDIASLEQLCKRRGLFATGGSDFHGEEDKDFVFDLPWQTQKILF